ncbi:putative rhomboid protease [Loxospora ochrophaea]|nr:putative rhomboid protease [Loxospora ochrophaea]
MAYTFSQFNPARLRSYVFRLPLFTRITILLIVLFWILELQSTWNVVSWGALVPNEVGFTTMYRLNTYPLIHAGLLHALINTLALTPLLERFEAEHGTLLTGALFGGPLSTLPAGAYLLIERGLLRSNTPVLGASVWIFVLLGVEAIKTFKTNPYFTLSTYHIPTWLTPLLILLFTTALIPNTSFLAHLSCVATGYLYGLNYLSLLSPPEKVLRYLESKLNLLGRLPHYVSIDQKTYGRYGVLPTTSGPSNAATGAGAAEGAVPMTYLGGTQRLGP